MGKTWDTKRKIMKLVSKGAKTPGEISDELGLAPSTVSEHIDELERMGAISKVDNPFIKKWKYYKTNPEFNVERAIGSRFGGRIPQVFAVLAILVGLAAFFALGVPAFGGGNQLAFRLTDPPIVPNGTRALNITYSSLQAHYVGNGTSGWVSASGSGSLDLMRLINVSQVIGTGKIPANASVDMVSFAITSAKIAINGTTYNVTVPNSKLSARITGGARATTNSSVLIDLSPVVASIFTQNSTVFVLVPSVKAVFVGSTKAQLHMGARAQLSSDEQNELSGAIPSIGITSESLVVSGNTTRFSVTVKNNANESVVIRHVALYGLQGVTVSANTIVGNTLRVDIEARPDFAQFKEIENTNDGEGHGRGGLLRDSDIQLGANGTATIAGVHVRGSDHAVTEVDKSDIKESPGLGTLVRVGAQAKMFRNLNFLVTSNGTLVLPFLHEDIDRDSGFVLKAGASATFAFSAPIVFGNGHIIAKPLVGSTYGVVVTGEEDASASTNVTARSG